MKNIEILFETDDILAVNKPAGLKVHPDGRSDDETLSDWFVKRYPSAADVGEPAKLSNDTVIPRPGIVHRLDSATSGVIILAKNQEAFMALKEQFQNRTIKKVYRAFVYASVKDDRGVINRPIGKSKSDPRLWSAQRGARGIMRDAVTHYRVIKRGNGATYLELRPKTGRTHQIRVHMKALNHPVVADPLYAPTQPPVLGFSRLALHALSVSFKDLTGTEVVVEAPLPDDFLKAVDIL